MFQLRSEDVAWREVDGDVVVLDLRTSRYLQVNGSGATLWPLLVAGTTEADLTAALQAAYELDELEATRDVTGFLDALRARELVVETAERP